MAENGWNEEKLNVAIKMGARHLFNHKLAVADGTLNIEPAKQCHEACYIQNDELQSDDIPM